MCAVAAEVSFSSWDSTAAMTEPRAGPGGGEAASLNRRSMSISPTVISLNANCGLPLLTSSSSVRTHPEYLFP